MAKAKGWKEIAKFEWDKKEYPVRVSTVHGGFEIEVPGKDGKTVSLYHDDLREVKEKARKHFEDMVEVKWEPTIFLSNDRAQRGEMDFRARRYFTATRGDGTVIWRNDVGNYGKDPELGDTNLEERDFPKYGLFIPYTRETWEAIRDFQKELYRFHELVFAGMYSRDPHGFVEVLKGGIRRILENPKGWKIEPRGY